MRKLWFGKQDRLCRDYSLAFLNRDRLIRIHVLQLIDATAGPGDFDACNLLSFAEAESQRQLALGSKARSRFHYAPKLLLSRHLQGDLRANAVAVRSCSNCLNPQKIVLIAAVVSKQPRRTVVAGYQQIEIAVVIEIAVSHAARDHR